MLTAGLCRVVITPPIGSALTGFAGRGPSEGVHDDLMATALAVADGQRGLALLALDLLYLPAGVVARIRAAVAERTGLAPDAIHLLCSHTHYGPDLGSDAEPPSEAVASYRDDLTRKVAGAVAAAWTGRHEVEVAVGSGASRIGVNRRERRPDGSIWLGQNPDGPVDRDLAVLRLDGADGAPVASVVGFACHPVCQGSRQTLISADYPGRMRAAAEALTGSPWVFVQGAAGNINPVHMEHGYEPARRLGNSLGAAVVQAYEEARPAPGEIVATLRSELALPAMTFPTREMGHTAVESLEAEHRRLTETGAAAGSLWWCEHRLKRARAMLASRESGEALPPVPAEVSAFRVGPLAAVTVPGELFCEIGMRIKATSPFSPTLIAGYANGSVGYLPTVAAYAEGGYEVTHACRVDPEAGAMIEAEAGRLLATLAGVATTR
jgi:neutral ceramidase